MITTRSLLPDLSIAGWTCWNEHIFANASFCSSSLSAFGVGELRLRLARTQAEALLVRLLIEFFASVERVALADDPDLAGAVAGDGRAERAGLRDLAARRRADIGVGGRVGPVRGPFEVRGGDGWEGERPGDQRRRRVQATPTDRVPRTLQRFAPSPSSLPAAGRPLTRCRELTALRPIAPVWLLVPAPGPIRAGPRLTPNQRR